MKFEQLVSQIRSLHDQLARQASNAVNLGLTMRNWLIGSHIQEYELLGEDRSQYGKRLFDLLASRLTALGLPNCDRRQLYRYVDFYRAYPSIVGTLSPQLREMLPSRFVVEGLALQRCVAPRSKLYAQEWFPTTALPELLGIPLGQFNNTRVHRALDALSATTPRLQEKLTAPYQDREPAFGAMFLDVTDTYFEGHGCESAKRSRTKAGHRNKWCISIVLLADQKGFPLRWTVVPGRVKDHTAMGEMIAGIRDLEWAKGVPLVCDRAMGMQGTVKDLHDSGLWLFGPGGLLPPGPSSSSRPVLPFPHDPLWRRPPYSRLGAGLRPARRLGHSSLAGYFCDEDHPRAGHADPRRHYGLHRRSDARLGLEGNAAFKQHGAWWGLYPVRWDHLPDDSLRSPFSTDSLMAGSREGSIFWR